MKISIPKERRPYEYRVAAVPETVKKLIEAGAEVYVEGGAGEGADILDAEYEAVGAHLATSPKELFKNADLVLKVQRPLLKKEGSVDEIDLIPEGATLIGLLGYDQHEAHRDAYAKKNLNVISLENIPRITRAQAMDVLSSQANLAGYKAVIDGAAVFGKAFPMMMTAAGTIKPAIVLVLGAGVAGLQAIATAKRLGAVVLVFDVRPAAKEQVESLGGKFIEVPAEEDAETEGGYAKEMSEAYKLKQAALIHETVKKADVVITTALIPGRPAPVLITEEMVKDMKPGSVIVDLAVEAGGNCPLTEYGKVVTKHNVTLVGYPNMPARLARDSSPLFARNVLQLFNLLWDKEKKALHLDLNDEIVAASTRLIQGKIPESSPSTAAKKKEA